MSKLLNYIVGKRSIIVQRTSFKPSSSRAKFVHVLRFRVEDWTTVVVGVGKDERAAYDRATQQYVDFCVCYELRFRDRRNLLIYDLADNEAYDYRLSDEFYAEKYQG